MPRLGRDEDGDPCLFVDDGDDAFETWSVTHASLEADVNQRLASLSVEQETSFRRCLFHYETATRKVASEASAYKAQLEMLELAEGVFAAFTRLAVFVSIALVCISLAWSGWLTVALAAAGYGAVRWWERSLGRLQRIRTEAADKHREAMRDIEQQLLAGELRGTCAFGDLQREDALSWLLRSLTVRQKLLDHVEDAASSRWSQRQLPAC